VVVAVVTHSAAVAATVSDDEFDVATTCSVTLSGDTTSVDSALVVRSSTDVAVALVAVGELEEVRGTAAVHSVLV